MKSAGRMSSGVLDVPAYGDLRALNTSRIILDSLSEEVLLEIVQDFLDLLGTSSAVYERNGDYALGIFSSGWCQFLDQASRNLCGTGDNRAALACGQWHCHESCWTEVSKRSIEAGEPVDRECAGGLRLYAVPIRAGDEVVGAINVGYGDPPRDPKILRELAAKYQVEEAELARLAAAYETRPPEIIELAKRRVGFAARLIGEMVRRRQVEGALAAANEELDKFFKFALELLCIADLEGRFVRLNPLWEKTLGYSVGELEGQPFLDYVHPGDKAATLAAVQALNEQQAVVGFTNRYRHRDGSYRWIEWRSYPAEGKIYAAARDITEQKEAEEALRNSEEQYRTTVVALFEGVMVFDAQARVLTANPAAERILGLKLEEMQRQKTSLKEWRVVREDGSPFPHDQLPIARALATGQPQRRVIFGSLRSDDSVGWLEVNAEPVVQPATGAVETVVVSFTDISEQKRTEEALRENRRFLADLVEYSGALVYVKDREGRYLLVNREWEAVTGMARETVLGRTDEELFGPAVAARFRANDLEAMASAQAVEREEFLVGASGRRDYISVKFALRDAQGQVTGVCGMTTEITARKRAEDALRESEERLRLALTAANQGLYDLNVQTGEAVVSPEYARMLGYEPEEFHETNAAWRERLHPDDLEPVYQVYREYLAGQRSEYRVEFRQRTKSGEWKWILSLGKIVGWDAAGNPLRMLGTHTDITGRKRMGEALVESEERLRSMMDSVDAIVWLKDEAGRFLMVNRYFLEKHGWTAGQVLGRTVMDLFPRELAAAYAANDQRVWAAGRLMRFEEMVRLPEGERTMLAIKFPVRDARGGMHQLAAICTDITESRQAEQALRESEERYHRLFDGITDMVLVHDVAEDGQLGRFLAVNDAACRRLGYTREELMGMRVSGIDAPESTVDVPAVVARLRQGERVLFEQIHRTKDGKRFPVEISAQVFTLQGRPVVLSVIRDITERKAAEAALQVSERNYREVFNATNEAIFIDDAATGQMLDVNEAMLRMYGYECKADVLSGNVGDLSANEPPYTQEEAIRRVHLALTEGPQVFEWLARKKHGERFWVEVSLRASAIGGEGRVLAVVRDISARKRAEAALAEQERFVSTVVRTMPDVVFVFDLEERRPVYRNREMMDVLGYSAAEVEALGPDFLEHLMHPEDAPVMREHLAAMRRAGDGEVLGAEYRMKAKSGEYRWFQARDAVFQRDAFGAARQILSVTQDITARRRAEEARRLDEARLVAQIKLSEMTGASLDELAAFALEEAVRLTQSEMGYVAFTNEDETILTMHAWSATAMEQCRVKDISRRFVVAETGLWGEPIRQRRAVITNDYSAPQPQKKGTPEGHVPVRRHLGVPVFDGGRIVMVAGVGNKAEEYNETDIRQITLLMGGMYQIQQRQREKAEQEKLREQLEQAHKIESVGRLAGGVAHDFNNMLQAILGNAALALQDLPPEHPVRENLEEIERSGQRSAELTRQLLAFARKQTIAPKVLDLNDVVAGMLKMLRRLIGEDIELAWLPGPGVWPVKMDPSQVDQILANLCVNARDAMPEGGTLTIETANTVLDETYAQSHADCMPGDYVMLMVSDTGCGMDARTREHLFEPFFTTKELGKGTGLGLATIFGIVKQNRGLIYVYSEPGEGTTFKIYLPRAVETPPPSARAQGEAGRVADHPAVTVLLVEDEGQILTLAQRILTQHGHTVLVARTPDEALKVASAHEGPIDLLITDVVMPGMNGAKLREQVAARRPGLRCIYMSGYTANVIAHHGVLEEGVHFLQKPFTVRSLMSMVREVLLGGGGAPGTPAG